MPVLRGEETGEGVREPRDPGQGVVRPRDTLHRLLGKGAAGAPYPRPSGLPRAWPEGSAVSVHWPVPRLWEGAGELDRGFAGLPRGGSRGPVSPCDVVAFATDSHLGRKISTSNAMFRSLCPTFLPFPNPWLVTVTSLTAYHFMWSIYTYTSCLSVSSESGTFHEVPRQMKGEIPVKSTLDGDG